MSDIIKTAVIAGVVHKVLSEKENSDKTDTGYWHGSSQSGDVTDKEVNIFYCILLFIFSALFLIIGIKYNTFIALIGGSFLILSVYLLFLNIKKTT